MLRQTVQPYASSTARDAALAAVLKEGMVAYLEDSNAVTVYDGSSWSTLGGGGGGVVNAVTAGTNLNGGGSSATVTLNLDTTLTGLSSVTSTSVVGALTGNASTATALQTARTIGGVSFDGTGNINLPGVNTAGNQATSGLAATATALATARTIGGVSFNGTANINLPGVNTAGNQATSGNAATASKWSAATTLTLGGDLTGNVVFDGSDTTETLTAVVVNNSHTHTGTTLSAIPASDITAGTFGSGNYTVSGTLSATTLSASGDVNVGSNGGGDSAVQFYDDNSNTWRTFMWDDSANRFYFEGNIAPSGNIYGPAGSAAAPTYNFSSDTNTGMYRATTDQLGFSTGGAVRATIKSDGIHLASGDWFRTYGSAGWYSQSYGGGWYMTDTTWVRAYNGKSILTTGKIYLGAMTTFTSGGYATARRKDSTGYFMELVSSERFKTNITDLDLAEASKILDARPIKYQDIVEAAEDPDSPYQVGLSAESLHEAGYPWVLKYDYDDETKITDFTKPRGIHYEFLVAPLLVIVKDLKTRLAAVEAAL